MPNKVLGRDRSYVWHVYDVTQNRREIAFSGNAPREPDEAFVEALARAKKYQNCPIKERGFCARKPRAMRPIVLVTVVDQRGQITHSSVLHPNTPLSGNNPTGR